MKQLIDLWQKILTDGEERKDRTGVGTKAVFGGQLEFDLREKFPLVTIKKTLWKSAFIEMLWFLRGEPNVKYLHEHGVKIWDDWADADGNLGPVYGVQWRAWPSRTSFQYIDQIKDLINLMKTQPNGRRHIVTAWNPTFIDVMGLPPCHRDFQCYVSNDKHLDLMMAIRSWDTCLGGPFNIAQYAFLTHLLARAVGLTPRRLLINYGDAHMYLNHVEPMRQLLAERTAIDCPTHLVINTENIDIDGYKPEDFSVEGYESHPFVKLPIAV